MKSLVNGSSEKPALDIRMLGHLRVQQGDRLVEFTTGKAKSLFSYLAVHRRSLHHREKLAERFWANGEELKPKKNNLKTTLWEIRTALRDQNLEEPYIYADRNLVGVNPSSRHLFQLDIDRFEQLVHRGLGEGCERDIQALKEAVALYRGEFIEDLYDDWCLYKREDCSVLYTAAVDAISEHCSDQGDYTRAVHWRLALWDVDPWCEWTLQHLMVPYAQCGRLNEALELCRSFAERLADRHGIGLQGETVELYHRIRNLREAPASLLNAEQAARPARV